MQLSTRVQPQSVWYIRIHLGTRRAEKAAEKDTELRHGALPLTHRKHSGNVGPRFITAHFHFTFKESRTYLALISLRKPDFKNVQLSKRLQIITGFVAQILDPCSPWMSFSYFICPGKWDYLKRGSGAIENQKMEVSGAAASRKPIKNEAAQVKNA
eukprot:bmy_04315T0